MRKSVCWRLSVHTTPDAEDATSQLLERIFHQPAVTYCKEEASAVRVSLFLEKNPTAMTARMQRLRLELTKLAEAGFFQKPGRITVKKIHDQDWAESWKRHFKCIEVNSRLLIRPSWSRRKPKKNQAVVTLDPGLSFGTGHHPTTAFCLNQIVVRREPGTPQSLLDIGTGSGILALAAVRLGYAPVKAFDCDPVATRIAISNARLNQLHDRIEFSVAYLEDFSPAQSGRYSVVCANLEYPLIVAHARRLADLLEPKGCLIVAGILVSQFAAVVTALSQQGLKKVSTNRGPQWQSGAFVLEEHS